MTSVPIAGNSIHFELQWLNVLLQREVLRLRAAHLLSAGELHGLYLSDAHVSALLRQAQSSAADPSPDAEQLTLEANQLREKFRAKPAAESPLGRLAALFELEELEREVLLLALAPELGYFDSVCCISCRKTQRHPLLHWRVRFIFRAAFSITCSIFPATRPSWAASPKK